jgi:hypothetical protein
VNHMSRALWFAAVVMLAIAPAARAQYDITKLFADGDTIPGSVNTWSINAGAIPSLPLSLTLCQTDPASGQRISAIGASVTATIDSGVTPTFAIFAEASAAIPVAPGSNRVFVRFADASGTIRGATSVAVRTQ